MKLVCQSCHNTIINNNKYFCSLKCYHFNRRGKPWFKKLSIKKYKKVCRICKKHFLSKRRAKSFYCSSSCRRKAIRNSKLGQIRRREYPLKRKLKLILIKGGHCELCGFDKHYGCLVFHHKNPAIKLFNLRTQELRNHSWKSILNEANKCLLLCQNCHHMIHEQMFNKNPCSNYKRKWQRNKYITIKKHLIKLLGNKCNLCGFTYGGIQALTFHHLNPDKKIFGLNSSNLANKTLSNILNEANKCQLLCSNCHFIVHCKNDYMLIMNKYSDN